MELGECESEFHSTVWSGPVQTSLHLSLSGTLIPSKSLPVSSQ